MPVLYVLVRIINLDCLRCAIKKKNPCQEEKEEQRVRIETMCGKGATAVFVVVLAFPVSTADH
jgi:hypothetical protein